MINSLINSFGETFILFILEKNNIFIFLLINNFNRSILRSIVDYNYLKSAILVSGLN